MNNEADMSDRVYLDIISGDGPDVLAGFSRYSQFDSDKVLIDLNPLIDATDCTGLDRSQYFDNILRAQESGGKLYQLPVEFDLYGLIGNKTLVGDAKPRSYDEFMQQMDALPSDVSVMYETDDKDFLVMFLGECGENFIDYSSQTVDFDNDAFKKILEIVKKYGIRNLNRREESRDDMSLFEDKKLAWYMMYMFSLREYGDYLARYGNDITFSGFPGNNGNGVVANVATSVGISAYSKNSKEAWDFIRFILSNTETEDLTGAIRFPISRSGLDRLNEALIAESEEKLKNQDPDSHYQISKLTPDMAEELVSIVESVTAVRKTDPAVMLIIYEEAPAYLLGQKNVDDVADIIQSRCKTIVQERG
ncbi:MAG: extracellular solute-binding protein [Lachnospiraceae bacterium]|nr:extracellular solute-binding protein [Lachnospiraceae bacterium]